MAGSRRKQSAAYQPRTQEVFACLARAGRFRDEETAEHVERMSRSCALIARELQFSPRACTNLMIASAMHDIGKIGVPDAVLLKPGPLNSKERAMIERHPEIGHQILSGLRDPVMQLAATIALTHHERVDGRGYPCHLRGRRIPLPGRIAAVADVFDALTHDRVYRPALSIDDALSVMRAGRGTQFDPRVLDAFAAALSQILENERLFPNPAGHQPGTRYPAQASGAAHALGPVPSRPAHQHPWGITPEPSKQPNAQQP
jgi:two-component system response regulator RpfG